MADQVETEASQDEPERSGTWARRITLTIGLVLLGVFSIGWLGFCGWMLKTLAVWLGAFLWYVLAG